MYPTGASSPKLYGLPKIHKKDIPLRSIVSSQGSVSYGVAKELARILKPLAGNNSHQVNNSKEFADDIKKMRLEEGECIMSYDVAALFTSIPVKPAMQQDTELHQRTTMSIQHILDLLESCLCNTYFLFQGQYYEQTQGAAMGSPWVLCWLIYIWSSLKIGHYQQQWTHPDGGKDLWMTYLSYWSKTRKKSSCNI